MKQPVNASTQASSYQASMANNGIIDFDNVTSGDMTFSLACDGSAFWQVDLGGVFNISRVMIWNRYPWSQANTTVGVALGARLRGASVQLLNYFGWPVGNYTLNAQMVQTMLIPTYLPSPTQTSTQTPSSTSTTTATNTPSLTSTHSLGSSPSSTLTPSVTPLSPYPYAARLVCTGTGETFNFVELLVFDINNRNVGALAAGASVLQTSTYPGSQTCPTGGTGYCAGFGADLNADPNAVSAPGAFISGNNLGQTIDYYQASKRRSLRQGIVVCSL